ncbi:hypothetical protein E3Q23_03449 [Wallemia mellicola]|nr:hypothetical protein E3Q23_03449 [Wallemia mellicola]
MQFKFGVVDIAPTLATDEAIRGVYRLPYHPPLSNFLPSLSMLSTVNRWSNTIEVDMVVIERGMLEENILCRLSSMPFCSRCGDICKPGDKCKKCGGSAVSGQVKWPAESKKSDSWIRTYVKASNRKDVFTNHTEAPKKEHIECPSSPLLETADGTLTKLVGSVLSPETPLTHPFCESCAVRFAPNATLYIHPDDDAGSQRARAYCYHCFVAYFSKGTCVVCSKAVLGEVRVEGKYVETSAGIFHAKCFECDGCGVDLSKDPIVDLSGWPCCSGCFDGSVARAEARRKGGKQHRKTTSFDPAIRGLNNRLGLSVSPQTSPSRRSGRLSQLETDMSAVSLNSTPEKEGSLASLADVASKTSKERRLSARDIVTGRSFEGVTKYASPPPSPPKKRDSIETFPRPSQVRSRSQSIDNTDICKSCRLEITTTIVRVPGEGVFHSACVKCAQCNTLLANEESDKMTVMKRPSDGKLVHVGCLPGGAMPASPNKSPLRATNLANDINTSRSVYKTPPKGVSKAPIHATLTPSPSTAVKPVPRTTKTPSPTKQQKSIWATRSSPFSSSAFGGMSSCPSCGDKLTLFECTPGPAGTKYHKKCLICRGCSKGLDSFAKVDFDGYVWCRGCFDTYVPKPRPMSYLSS